MTDSTQTIEAREPLIKTGSAAMLGTTHTSRAFTSRAALRRALAPYSHLGDWRVFRETGYSRTGRCRPQYAGVIFEE